MGKSVSACHIPLAICTRVPLQSIEIGYTHCSGIPRLETLASMFSESLLHSIVDILENTKKIQSHALSGTINYSAFMKIPNVPTVNDHLLCMHY